MAAAEQSGQPSLAAASAWRMSYVIGSRSHLAEARQIERDFAGAWHIWISSAGRWWATRRGHDARWGHNTPPMTVDADDAAGLRAELANWGQ